MRLSAYREALDLFDRGLTLIADQPGTGERSSVERLLQVDRVVPQRSLSGAGSQELAGALAQAIEAGAGAVEGRTRLVTLQAEAELLSSRGQLDDLLSVGRQILDLATQLGDEGYAVYAHFWIGFAYNLRGDPHEAESHLGWVLDRHAPGRWPTLRAAVGYEITAPALTISAINKWSLGYPEQAAWYSAQAVTQAEALSDSYGLAVAAAIGCMTLFLLRGDVFALQERSELCHRVCAEHGFALWQKYVDAFTAWLAVSRGHSVAGMEGLQSAIAAWEGMGMVSGADSLLVVLADGCLTAAGERLSDGNRPDRCRPLRSAERGPRSHR